MLKCNKKVGQKNGAMVEKEAEQDGREVGEDMRQGDLEEWEPRGEL